MDFYRYKDENFENIAARDLRVGDSLRFDAGRPVGLSGVVCVKSCDNVLGTIYVAFTIVPGMYIKSSVVTTIEVDWYNNGNPVIVGKTKFDPDEIISILKREA